MTRPAICISSASMTDSKAIQQLVNRAYAAPDAARSWTNESGIVSGQRVSVADIEQLLTAPDTTLLVAVQEAAIIGSVTLIYGKDYCSLRLPTSQYSYSSRVSTSSSSISKIRLEFGGILPIWRSP